MNKTRQVFLAALATSFALPALAEEQSPIIVTATRTAQTADESLASVTVITKEQIAQQQANDLIDLLSGIAGIDMINSGGFGKDTSLYMRGTNSSHVLVMIDGVQIGSATLGQVAYQDIPVDLIEKIEIVRGARASLYGSEAIGGVIQIFTRKARDKTAMNFSSSYGRYNTKKNSAGISGKINKTSYSLQASTFSTDGINAQEAFNTDNDGYKQNSANFSINHRFNNTDKIEATILQTNSLNEYDGTITNSDYYSEGFQEALGIQGSFNLMTDWQVLLKANQSSDNSELFQDSISTDVYKTKRDIYTWQNNISISDNNLFTLGFENKNTSISGTSTYIKSARENNSIFIQNNWTQDDNDLLLSLRRDDDKSFGVQNTGNISWGQKINSDTRLILSAATAFNAPSFNDLYFPDKGWGVGNPDLLPEDSRNYELSFKKKQMQVNFYSTKINNLIVWDNATGKWIPNNIGTVKIKGVEFLASVNIGGWDSKINLSYSDPIDAETGEIISNRSRESLRLDFDRTFTRYSLGATVKSQGIRYTSSTQLDSYTLIDLRANYNINKDWSLKGKITNALERKYTVNPGYNTPDKSIFVSIHYQGF